MSARNWARASAQVSSFSLMSARVGLCFQQVQKIISALFGSDTLSFN
jgi:precorrin-6B methylase 1